MISPEREKLLLSIAEAIKDSIQNHGQLYINFICTHNSRRSHFTSFWFYQALKYFNVNELTVTSGGTEVTQVYLSVIRAIKRDGFTFEKIIENDQEVYIDKKGGFKLFSKLYSDCKESFIAVMTCDDADQNCPMIPNAIKRLNLTYKDPKYSDGTSEEEDIYFKKSQEIKEEMYFIASKMKG